jgi:hypothetical protein
MTIREKFGIDVDGEVPDCQPQEVPADVYDRYRAMMKQTENLSNKEKIQAINRFRSGL